MRVNGTKTWQYQLLLATIKILASKCYPKYTSWPLIDLWISLSLILETNCQSKSDNKMLICFKKYFTTASDLSWHALIWPLNLSSLLNFICWLCWFKLIFKHIAYLQHIKMKLLLLLLLVFDFFLYSNESHKYDPKNSWSDTLYNKWVIFSFCSLIYNNYSFIVSY